MEPHAKSAPLSSASSAVKTAGPFVRDVITTTAGLAALAAFVDAKRGTDKDGPMIESAEAWQTTIDRNTPLHITETKKTVFVCSPYWDPSDLDTPIEYWGIFTLILPAAKATVTNDTKSVCREIPRDDVDGIVDEMMHKIDGIAKFYAICDPDSELDKDFTLNVRKTTKRGFKTQRYEDTIRIGRTRLRSLVESILSDY